MVFASNKVKKTCFLRFFQTQSSHNLNIYI